MWHRSLNNQKPVAARALLPLSKLIYSSLFILAITACSTIKVHTYDHDILHPYLGTKTAVNGFYDSFSDYVIYNQATLMAIDIPFCFVADTLMLPYDMAVWLIRHNE